MKLVAAVGMLSLIVSTACGSGTDQPTKTMKISFIGALTGDFAQLVIHAANGAELAIEQANAAGGLPVTLTFDRQDSQGSGDKATPIANQLKDDSEVVAVIGPAFSGESLAALPILGQAGIPMVTPSATNPAVAEVQDVSGTLWWRAVGNDFSQGDPAPDVITTYLKAKKVYIAHDKSAYGQGLADIVRDNLDDSLEAGFEGVDPGKKDYSPLVNSIVSSGADTFYWGGYSPEAALIMKQLRDRNSNVQFLGADGAKDDTFLGGKKAVEGAVLTCPCTDPNALDDEASKSFVADYTAKFGVAPGVYGAEGFDAATLVIEAIKKAGEPGDDIKAYRAAVADAIGQTSGFQGLTKSFAFEDNGELVADSVQIYLYKVENRKFTFLGNVQDLI
jgi:branched-chain amino acid transport system substrate-binding protein